MWKTNDIACSVSRGMIMYRESELSETTQTDIMASTGTYHSSQMPSKVGIALVLPPDKVMLM